MATVTAAEPDLDALERDATARLGELHEQRSRLALDALIDSTVQAELESIESEIHACDAALERVQLARNERGRRDAAAAAQADRERREAALNRARARQSKVDALAAEWDSLMERLAGITLELLRECDARDRDLGEAGRRPSASAPSMRATALAAAWVHHTRKVPRGVLQLEGAAPNPRDWRPLAEGLVRPVEPAEAS